jgi:hypothetical protein
MIAASRFFKPVSFVELDGRQRSVDHDALRACAHRVGFRQPVERRPHSTARRAATDVDRRSVPAPVDTVRGKPEHPVLLIDGDEEDFATFHRRAIPIRRQSGAPLADDLGRIDLWTDGLD